MDRLCYFTVMITLAELLKRYQYYSLYAVLCASCYIRASVILNHLIPMISKLRKQPELYCTINIPRHPTQQAQHITF